MNQALEILKSHGVILMPTDTTFGLGCAANSQKAIEKIKKIKNRPAEKNFILLVANNAMLQRLVEVPDLAWDIMDLSEKPVTIIYDEILNLPQHLISDEKTIAIRLVKEKWLIQLISKLGQPLVSTSANLSGENSPKSFNEISEKIKQKVDFILPQTEDFQPKFSGSSIIKISKDGRVKVVRE